MAACFFNADGHTYIISNSMSVFQAGFHPAKSYFNKDGDTLSYYIHDNGTVLARFGRRRRQTLNAFFQSKDEANKDFQKMNAGKTFRTGKWVPERKRA